MSVFSGRQGKGAMREHRAKKRAEAAERNKQSVEVWKCGHISSRSDHPCEVTR